jgi:putative SOS response-associated peptidase YedK
MDLFRWGLLPHWAKDPSFGGRTFNARGETVATKPAFRAAFRGRRCLIPADGFYEWTGPRGQRRPLYIHRRDGNLLALAGLWETWGGTDSPDQPALQSCTIITTEPNEFMGPIHNRMPVVLEPGDWDTWLDPDIQDAEGLLGLLRPPAEDVLTAYRVSPQVNNVRNNGPDLIRPYANA